MNLVILMIRMMFLKLISWYKKYISPTIGNHCRFFPTCSEYAYEAIERYGAAKGLILTVWRILRCNPLNKHIGYDPVPIKMKRIQ